MKVTSNEISEDICNEFKKWFHSCDYDNTLDYGDMDERRRLSKAFEAGYMISLEKFEKALSIIEEKLRNI